MCLLGLYIVEVNFYLPSEILLGCQMLGSSLVCRPPQKQASPKLLLKSRFLILETHQKIFISNDVVYPVFEDVLRQFADNSVCSTIRATLVLLSECVAPLSSKFPQRSKKVCSETYRFALTFMQTFCSAVV